MEKYIDADKLLAEAKELSGPVTGDGWDNLGVYSLIERQPAADVVKVVRCNCCKYYDKSTHNCGLYGVKHWGGFFCGDAEKEDEDNG